MKKALLTLVLIILIATVGILVANSSKDTEEPIDEESQEVEEESKAIFQSNIQRAAQQGAKQEDMESKKDELWKEAQTQAQARDKITIMLGQIAEIEKVEVDTAHFKGNYPDRCSLQASMAGNETDKELAAKAENWPELLSPQKLSMDQQHFFQKHQLQDLGPVNCVRLNIFPDGGISRLRIFGRPQF